MIRRETVETKWGRVEVRGMSALDCLWLRDNQDKGTSHCVPEIIRRCVTGQLPPLDSMTFAETEDLMGLWNKVFGLSDGIGETAPPKNRRRARPSNGSSPKGRDT